MRSIRENPALFGLPDFRNQGVWLRVLVISNVGALLVTLAANREWRDFAVEFGATAGLLEPVLLLSLALLTATQEWLERLPRRLGILLIVLLVLLVNVAVQGLASALLHSQPGTTIALGRTALWSTLATLGLLGWLDLYGRAQAPALTEARLLALTARIRPHFLFNSLNAVLGVIRTDPKRAEVAIEELSDLFRALMRENTSLVPLSEEIAVARQYINLERLRLGDRVNVRWDMTACPPDPLVPPLMLQPLLENAVYHGVEPASQPGEICVKFERFGHRLRLELSNSTADQERHGGGNQMALANIRERLMLFFDLEATMATEFCDGRFRVTIEFPYRPTTVS